MQFQENDGPNTQLAKTPKLLSIFLQALQVLASHSLDWWTDWLCYWPIKVSIILGAPMRFSKSESTPVNVYFITSLSWYIHASPFFRRKLKEPPEIGKIRGFQPWLNSEMSVRLNFFTTCLIHLAVEAPKLVPGVEVAPTLLRKAPAWVIIYASCFSSHQFCCS